MKQFLLKLTMSILLVSVTAFYTSAQTAVKGTATINSDLVIHIDETQALVADYSFDISAMHFNSQTACERYFSLCRDNILTYSVDYATKTASVHLALEYMEPRGWGVAEYNEYFQKVSERYRSTLSVVNQ